MFEFLGLEKSSRPVLESHGHWERRSDDIFLHFRCTSGAIGRDVVFSFDPETRGFQHSFGSPCKGVTQGCHGVIISRGPE